ncbi:hypothetical protein [Streptomyces sp. 1222.5]|uniref:hypothetical protein n=1 Tax=Streptomyces sp. 1222.5 TaxID=1881026 RepID=UPI003D7240B6
MRKIMTGTAATLVAAAVLCTGSPAQSLDGPRAAPGASRFCGTDPVSGLAVWGDRADACAAALEVASAYTKAAAGAPKGPGTVRAGGATWKCQERQGDPNPYQECVDSSDSGRRVILSS